MKNHEDYCHSNPERKIKKGNYNPNYGRKGKNQYSHGAKMKDETRERIKQKMIGKKLSKKHKDNISAGMKKAVIEHSESYSSSNVNGRVKKIEYNGITLDSKWEYEFVKWCDIKGIKWIRNTNGFKYEYNGDRIYYPDFYLDQFDLYVEVKGYVRERDIEKWKIIPNLLIIKKDEIKEIKDNTFIIRTHNSDG